VLSAVGAAAAGTAGGAARRDVTPPLFDGLQSATTCSPGPIGGGSSSYRLSWAAATDNRTPSTQIVYDVYQAGTAGGEDFSSPTYTTPVRARDRSGNSDANRVERQGVNLCV
jgi:hypothetical protein